MPFEIVRGDITVIRADAIVNAANPTLLGGGGVDGAIHRAAGPELLEECRGLGGCRVGEAKLTKAYRLPARYVIHTVGPVWEGGSKGEEALLSSCYRRSLELAFENGCESIAFPLISAGVYGYPVPQAVRVATEAVRRFLEDHDMTVWLVLYVGTRVIEERPLYHSVLDYVRMREEEREVKPAYCASPIDGFPEAPAEPAKRPAVKKRRASLKDGALPPVREEAAPLFEAAEGPAEDAGLMEKLRRELARKSDEGFSQALLRLIDEKGLTDAQCYKRANVDRRLFSKIRSNQGYRPGKPLVFAFAVALELSLPETEKLLQKAGFALSHSSRLDIILEYFISRQSYDIYRINEVLFEFDLPLLGSVMN